MGPGHVALLIPGLLGPATGRGPDAADALGAVVEGLELPALETILGHGRVGAGTAGDDLIDLFFRYIGLDPDLDPALPLAAFSRFAENEDAAHGAWIRADPVHLRPDLSKLVLLEGVHLDLSLDDAFGLAAHLNEAHAGALPFTVHPESATRWFVHLPTVPKIRTTAPSRAHGHDAAQFMPTGDEARAWHQNMNLTQMMLHDAPVNAQRNAVARTVVNSLWFWGAGRLPADRARLHGVRVHAHVAWIRGATRWLGGVVSSPVRVDPDAGPGHSAIVCVETFSRAGADADPLSYRARLAEVEQLWLAPLLGLLTRGNIASVSLHIGASRVIELNRGRLGRWWMPGYWRKASASDLLSRLQRACAQ